MGMVEKIDKPIFVCGARGALERNFLMSECMPPLTVSATLNSQHVSLTGFSTHFFFDMHLEEHAFQPTSK